MEMLKSALIDRAKNEYKEIYPCGGKSLFDDCFTVEGQKLIFWFNLASGTSCVVYNTF